MSTEGLLSWGTGPKWPGTPSHLRALLCLPCRWDTGGCHGADWICLILRPRAAGTGGAHATGWEGRLAGWVSGLVLGLQRTDAEPGTESRLQEPVRHQG